jgi:hypothetical protein
MPHTIYPNGEINTGNSSVYLAQVNVPAAGHTGFTENTLIAGCRVEGCCAEHLLLATRAEYRGSTRQGRQNTIYRSSVRSLR